MTKLLATTLIFLFIVSFADAQSFYKRNRKFKRTYMAHAITGAVSRPSVIAYSYKVANFTTSTGSVEDERPYSSRAMRKAQRRAERASMRLARAFARDERRMHRAEERALRDHLVDNSGRGTIAYSR